jgi:hypothetical protein
MLRHLAMFRISEWENTLVISSLSMEVNINKSLLLIARRHNYCVLKPVFVCVKTSIEIALASNSKQASN